MPLSFAIARTKLAPTMQRLYRGFDPEWGWWVSADRVRFVYSSVSAAQADENFIAEQSERMSHDHCSV